MKKLFIMAALLMSLVTTGMVQAAEKWDGSIMVAGQQVNDCYIKVANTKGSAKLVYMLPLRGISEALEYTVGWDDVNQVAIVKSPGETVISKNIGNVALERKVMPAVIWAVYQDRIEINSEGTGYTYKFNPDQLKPESQNGRIYLSLDTVKQVFGLKEQDNR